MTPARLAKSGVKPRKGEATGGGSPGLHEGFAKEDWGYPLIGKASLARREGQRPCSELDRSNELTFNECGIVALSARLN